MPGQTSRVESGTCHRTQAQFGVDRPPALPRIPHYLSHAFSAHTLSARRHSQMHVLPAPSPPLHLQVSDEELVALAETLVASEHLTGLNLAGNPITARGLHTLFAASASHPSVPPKPQSSPPKLRLTELDLSRTRLGGQGEAADADLGALACEIARSDGLHGSLNLANIVLSDTSGAIFMSKLTSTLQPGCAIRITHLNLSRNALGQATIGALSGALPCCVMLCTLNISHNNLGSAAGGETLTMCLRLPSLRTLDLSGANLCDCSPLHPRAGPALWTAAAIRALVGALDGSALTELHLHSNELCGLWMERVCGEHAQRGIYTPEALDSLVGILENGARSRGA